MPVPASLAPASPVPVVAAVHALLAPFELVIASALVAAHTGLTAAGLPATSGLTWAAAIAALVAVVRLALLPLALHQVRSARRLAAAAPALREVRDRYRGVRDPEAVARLRRESADVRAEVGASGLGCLPVLLQAPVLLALVGVLSAAAHGRPVAAMTPAPVAQLDAATLCGATLGDTLHTGGTATALAAALTAVVAATSWLTQHRQITRNTPPDALEGVAGQSQRLSVWLVPLVAAVSGLTLPVGVLLYWACTGTWSLVQQLAVVRWLPTPGSPASAARAARSGPQVPQKVW